MSDTNRHEARNKERYPTGKPEESRHDGSAGNGVPQAGPAVHRRVLTGGSGGVRATVIVVARQGKVLLSIDPPFTWEAILEPEKVNELVRVLGQAEDDATRMLLTVATGRITKPK